MVEEDLKKLQAEGKIEDLPVVETPAITDDQKAQQAQKDAFTSIDNLIFGLRTVKQPLSAVPTQTPQNNLDQTQYYGGNVYWYDTSSKTWKTAGSKTQAFTGGFAPSGSSNAITGVGFLPDLIEFRYYGRYVSGGIVGIGFGTGTSRGSVENSCWAGMQFSGGSFQEITPRDDTAYAIKAALADGGGGAKEMKGSVAHDADGFTITWAFREFSSAYIEYTAWKF